MNVVDEATMRGWYTGMDFAYDWTSNNLPTWMKVLGPLRGRPDVRLLEIGSYEGRSAVFFLNFLPQATLVCVDPWDPAVLEPALIELMPELVVEFSRAEERFDRNIAAVADRMVKIKGYSSETLPVLGVRGDRFDAIYVDGDHRRSAAYRDCVLSWPLLKRGGVLILDDYDWGLQLPDELKPKQGIDAFMATVAGQVDELHRGYQLIVRKR